MASKNISPTGTHKDNGSTPENIPQIISFELGQIFEIVNFVCLGGAVCLFGIIANVINIVIFVKQGLDNTVNISLFSLAISDLLSVLTLEWTNIFLCPFFANSDIPWNVREVQYLTGSWLHACFGNITCWITAYMTAERCLCIIKPLEVKTMVTPLRTTSVIIFIYMINLASLVPEYASVYLDWKFYPEKNVSLISLAYRQNRDDMDRLGFMFLAMLGAVSFPAVIVLTAILVFNLKSQAKWRAENTGVDKLCVVRLKRNLKTVKMVVLIAAVLIVCYTPGVFASVASYVVPGLTISGDQSNLLFVMWSFPFLCEAINSSVNIFMYYRMSTKYRNTFHRIFGTCGCQHLSAHEEEY